MDPLVKSIDGMYSVCACPSGHAELDALSSESPVCDDCGAKRSLSELAGASVAVPPADLGVHRPRRGWQCARMLNPDFPLV
eukprot:6469161-Amphidinium_carterae.5